MDFNKVKPYNQEEEKTAQLSRMFNSISGQYDKFNDIMSWGMARIWRRKSLLALKAYNPKQILDIATGTADMCVKAFKFLQPEHVTGIDISEKMMEVGRMKLTEANLSDKVDLQVQDVSSMTFEDNTFDAATIAFGIRNFERLDQSLQEIHRVLKSGGHLLIVEMNEPQKGVLLWAYKLYIRLYVRTTTQLLSTDREAYSYLTASMQAFPNGEKLIAIMQQNGLIKKKYRRFLFGVCSMYLMEKH